MTVNLQGMEEDTLENADNQISTEQDEIDYDELYGGISPDVDSEMSPELEKSYLDIFKDVLKQGTKEVLIGVGGAYGDLAELAGVNPYNRAEEARNSRDFQTLEKMEQPGYQPSFSDIYSLSGDDELAPSNLRFPTQQNLRDVNQAIGGPGEPETGPGRYAQRTAGLYGTGLAFGQVNPLPAVVAGSAGQTAEEYGADPLTQAGIEIATLIATVGKGKKGLGIHGKEAQNEINKLRKLGYSDEEITLAINKGSKFRKNIASKGEKTEEAFENFYNKSDELVSDILAKEVPGVEKGISKVHEMASDAYSQMLKDAPNLTITQPKPFLDASKNVTDRLQKTLGKNPEAQAFIKRISEAAMDATQFPTAENFVNFYKELNQLGKWMGRSEKDHLITMVKNGIKDTFKAEGKAGKEFAEKFEKANQGIQKAYKAEELVDILEKVTSDGKIDFKKFNKVFDKADNVKLFEDVLGKTQANNVRQISSTAKDIKEFYKSWKKASLFDKAITVGAGIPATLYFYKGDYENMVKALGVKGGSSVVRKINELSLRNPKFQRIWLRGLHAIKNASPQAYQSANRDMQNFLDEQGIEVDLSE